MIASASAISLPSGFTGLSMPAASSSFGSGTSPASNLEVSSPTTPFGSNNWALNNQQYFQPSHATQQTAGTGMGIPSSDVGSILQMMSNLPSPQQVQQAQSATPTPTPVNTFTQVSTEIPADQVIFLEVSKNILYVDSSAAGFKVPTVTMNYQYDTKNKKLILKNKNGTDVSGAKIIVGYTRQNDVDGSYLFDYNIGSVPYDDMPIKFSGADGRISIMLNGTQKDLMPGEKAEASTRQDNLMISITVTNFGLIPKANIQVKDSL